MKFFSQFPFILGMVGYECQNALSFLENKPMYYSQKSICLLCFLAL